MSKENQNLDCKDYSKYSLGKKDINQNFFFLNAHGEELEQLYEVPKGVRIIMFCYSKELQVCDRFDRFNWENILLDPKTSSNYCNFLGSISRYSSIRDHFCVYEENDVIRNMTIFTDKTFREGLYRLPVKGYAYDEKNKTVVVSEGTLLSEVQKDSRLKKLMKDAPRTHIKVDGRRVANLLRKESDVGIIQSQVRKIHDKARLSNLINSMRLHIPEFTILLMVCRERSEEDRMYTEGVADDISDGKQLLDEMKQMERYLELEKIMKS